MANDFTLDDFRRQLDHLQKMDLVRMPVLAELVPEEEDRDLALRRIRRMIDAMTDEDRCNPDLISSSSLSRIAASSGTHPHEVEKLLTQFQKLRTLMRQMSGMGLWERIKMVLGLRRA